MSDLIVHAKVSTALRQTLGNESGHVSLTVRDGIVTLKGTVSNAQAKLDAERVVAAVSGVRAIADEVRVAPVSSEAHDDPATAQAVLDAFNRGFRGIGRQITVRVEDGWVFLGGSVASPAEYDAVERALACVPTIRGITSEVRINSQEASCQPQRS